MFLKRIEMQGFKSFADRVTISFDSNMTGIVGPNGCGKSNISDAVRWVLGEQSVRSLRGEKMTDVIFAGSEGRRALNMAEVTLVFDNKDRILNSDLDEIEVTRRIYNTDQDAEYLINRKNVRLKDVIDLILDTGLGKDSLSMISQGNVSSFAEAKPYDRRAIFEEAAGVAKYKKRKNESLNRLERTKENLDRSFDILSELEKQVSPLKRAAAKAEIYRQKRKRLEEIEIAVLVRGISELNARKEEVGKSRFDLETEISMQQTTINVNENGSFELKNRQREIDREISELQEKLVASINDIQRLENRKVEMDEKRKYALETGGTEERARRMEEMLSEAKMEYDDRSSRYEKTKAEIELLNKNLEETVLRYVEAGFKREESSNLQRRLENRAALLENLLKDPFSSRNQQGVKTIMDNRSSFPGVLGVVGQEIHPEKGYEEAVSAALAGSVYHIITRDEAAARKAIAFLRNNRSGRATFLPMSVLRDRFLSRDQQTIAENSAGYLGTADQFVDCDPKFDPVRYSLLGNVLVTDTLENANELGTLLKHAFNIVTLEGDIVHRGGTMTGGKVKNATSIVTAQNELDDIRQQLVSAEAESTLNEKEYQRLEGEKNRLESAITEKRIANAQLEAIVETKRAKYEKLKSDYDVLAPGRESEEAGFFDTVVKELNEAYARKDDLSSSLKSKREERVRISNELDRKDAQIRLKRRELDKANESLRDVISQQAVLKTRLDENLNRLASEYQMTYEYALENLNPEAEDGSVEEVKALREEIRSLGNVNMSAPEEYEEISRRYEFLKKNYDDLLASRDKILKAIEEMDETMKAQFKETFDEINAELPNTFTALFGGGKAKLVLEDENDILNTGIDIDVQPPGKAVKSIRLFSGGEKTLIAICVLFTILKIRHTPLVIFDEVEAALDEANVERFARYVKEYAEKSQFLLITHRPGTMEKCDVLYGVTMQKRGVSQMMKVRLVDAVQMAEKEVA
ncbi:MAG: AAA family ATPase [Erysipelotrichaceae bacterium]|nr:AAA family ATPase [Erysipelotrichaceae bacterium]